ncbi:Nitronate monooxygenase [Thalictrum thalictroides]|uniref:Nitronate monooxygenase n=1 Tax=Thalictrum thalictroides TaxID=46969 RepID=A0A7J6WS47_THATH|nr:Nitronate monooxygenase [Thalictrum thalictroides]
MKAGGILGVEHGIVLAPMGPDVSGPKLVAAVANAGGLGLLAGPVNNYDETVKAIKKIKTLTNKPFGVGILLEFDNTKTIQAIYDEKLSFLQVYWGEFPKERVVEAHAHGVKVLHQVGSVEEARKAIAAGVDCIIAQGVEAGGHIRGTVSLMALLPRIVDLVGHRDIPVVAAGSICDARGYAAALALGAKGVCLGTRFIATKEAYANEYYKQQLLSYTEQQTDRTDLYGRKTWRAFVRCLNTPFHQKWRKSPDYDKLVNDETQPIIAHSKIYNKECDFRRFAGQVANPTTKGELENMCMLAGQGVGLVHDIVPAAEIVKRFVEGVKAIMGGETPANKNDVFALNAHLVRDTRVTKYCSWASPKQDYVMLNTDGSVKDDGKWQHLCRWEFNYARTWSLRRSKLAGSDSKEVVDGVLGNVKTTWRNKHLINRIKALAGTFKDFEIKHIYRENNSAADCFTKLECTNDRCIFSSNSIPKELNLLVSKDRTCHLYQRS